VTPGRDLGSIARNLSLKALSLGLERGSRLLITLLAAPVLGKASFGVFVFAAAVTAFVALAADLGIGVWSTRALARSQSDRSSVVRASLLFRAATALPYATVVAVLALAQSGEARIAMALLGAFALFNAFADHFCAVFRGTEEFGLEARLNGLRAFLTLAFGAFALTVGRSLASVASAMALSSAAAALYGMTEVLRLHGVSLSPASWRTAFGPLGLRGILRESVPIGVAGLVSLLYFKVDTVFVRSFAGDAELGAYGAAYKLFEAAMLVPSAVLAVLFPRLVRVHDSPRERRRLERAIVGSLFGLGVLLGAVAALARAPLVRLLFGPEFQRSEDSLWVLACGIPVVFVNYGLTHFLIARHRERVNSVLAFMMLVVVVALDLALIPTHAGPGAAAATAISELFLTAGCLVALAMSAERRARGAARTGPATE
jgi:PST family polysaccharide transporter